MLLILISIVSLALASIQSDCQAIASFARDSRIRESDFQILNLQNPNCCSTQIKCTASGIMELNMTGLGLVGSLRPLNLPFLEILSLSRNNLTGQIPPNWSLPQLKVLDLSRNYLQGSIPTMQMPRLETINLEANNQLQGEFPEMGIELRECRIPSSVCYSVEKNVPMACRAMIKCLNGMVDSTIGGATSDTTATSTAQNGLSLGAILGIVCGIIVVVVGTVIGFKYYRKVPEKTNSKLKILTVSQEVEYQDQYDIISSYR